MYKMHVAESLELIKNIVSQTQAPEAIQIHWNVRFAGRRERKLPMLLYPYSERNRVFCTRQRDEAKLVIKFGLFASTNFLNVPFTMSFRETLLWILLVFTLALSSNFFMWYTFLLPKCPNLQHLGKRHNGTWSPRPHHPSGPITETFGISTSGMNGFPHEIFVEVKRWSLMSDSKTVPDAGDTSSSFSDTVPPLRNADTRWKAVSKIEDFIV